MLQMWIQKLIQVNVKSISKKTFNIGITQVIIDNQFYSHKDNKILDMVKIFNEIKIIDEYSVIFEPKLFIAMIACR